MLLLSEQFVFPTTQPYDVSYLKRLISVSRDRKSETKEVKKRRIVASSLLFFTASLSVLRSRHGTNVFCGAFGKRLQISGSGPAQKHPGPRDTAGHNKMSRVIAGC